MNLINQTLLEVYHRLVEIETTLRTVRINNKLYDRKYFEPYVKISTVSMRATEESLEECRKKISEVMANIN